MFLFGITAQANNINQSTLKVGKTSSKKDLLKNGGSFFDHEYQSSQFKIRVTEDDRVELLEVNASSQSEGDPFDIGSLSQVKNGEFADLAIASYYRPTGNPTASGQPYSAITNKFAIAMKNLPLCSLVRLTYNDRSIVAEVNDRGPYIAGRSIDLQVPVKRVLKFPDIGHLDWKLIRRGDGKSCVDHNSYKRTKLNNKSSSKKSVRARS